MEMEEMVGETIEITDDSEVMFAGHHSPNPKSEDMDHSVLCSKFNLRDPTMIVSTGCDERAYIWNAEDGEVIREFADFNDSVVDAGFSGDGKYLATACLDGSIKIWEVKSGKMQQCLEGPSEPQWVRWHQKGYAVLAGGGDEESGTADGTVWLWHALSGDCLGVFAGHEGSISFGGFAPSVKKHFCTTTKGRLRLWSAKGECKKIYHSDHPDRWHLAEITSMAFHPTEALVATGAEDGTVCISNINPEKPSIISRFDHTPISAISEDDMFFSIESVDFCDQQRWLASGSMDGTLRVWNLENGSCRVVLRHPDGVNHVKWIPGTCMIISACVDGFLRVWDARTGETLREFGGHQAPINFMDCQFPVGASGDLKNLSIVTASDDHYCRIFKWE
eukprot:TRINITY_DN777825_c0_g1_i1.p1 TRINITY_DN777825_c0_g1~~TRINITY_DN777825_c0_g1_i1.p1  ORF type:complete len:450 (+),score=141.84 TRINITY_DN777825_c0_g1_i1:180-1352(+)